MFDWAHEIWYCGWARTCILEQIAYGLTSSLTEKCDVTPQTDDASSTSANFSFRLFILLYDAELAGLKLVNKKAVDVNM